MDAFLDQIESYTLPYSRMMRREQCDVAIRIDEFSEIVRRWAEKNFGPDVPVWQPLLGIGEELGELNHHFLKRAQGIRGTAEEHREAMGDAVADIFIYLVDFCNRERIDLDWEIRKAWTNTVSKRDWKANPITGVS